MRLVPPISDKEYFTTEEFKEYLLDHEVVGKDLSIPIKALLINEADEIGIESAVEKVCTMIPYPYQPRAKGIFTDFLNEQMPHRNGLKGDI